LRAVLYPLAGVFHVLTKAMGRVGTQAGDGHERDEINTTNIRLNSWFIFFMSIASPDNLVKSMGCNPTASKWKIKLKTFNDFFNT
jgi:hypothetical protein